MTTLKIDSISKKYGKYMALDNISLSIEPGIFGLLGPNGAGKSTFMRILTAIQTLDSGSIEYGTVNWRNQLDVKRLIGYLPQKFSLYKHLTVMECLMHIATMKGISKEKNAKVEYVLEQVNLLEHRNKKIGKLSGGMIRRVGIAQAILGEPQIIIVDEPTAGLDPEERIRFRNILHKIGQRNLIIISSHIVEDIETICGNIAILHKGKILATGNVNSIRQSVNNLIRSAKVNPEELLSLENKVKIIRQQPIENQIYIRFLSEGDIEPNSEVEMPTLEDAYFYYMQSVGN
ncbi:ABC transporter ATP-binding protein [Paenibacillus sp. NPDC058910]|uniref:ABC transporter ATP-binding protein n=1 Tax=unclassified Paenibacillus TaxID=185978 RepID=UPI0036865EBF